MLKALYKILFLASLFFFGIAFADTAPPIPPPGTTPSSTNTAVSPSASVTIGQSTQQLDQIKSFFDQSTYDDLSTPGSGLNTFAITEGS